MRRRSKAQGAMLNVLRKPLHLVNTSESYTDIAVEVPSQTVGVKPAAINKIWQAIKALYKTGTQPFISLCIRKQGKIIINRAIGHAKGNGPDGCVDTSMVPASTDQPICLYSSSKAVTAILMHKLAEQEAVNLSDPVSYYLPEFAKNGKRHITVLQILSHRGGIPGLPVDMPLETIFDRDKIWQLLCDAEPIAIDGAKLAYHAITGGFVLQRLLEKATGRAVGHYLDEHIRQPMALKYFTFGLEKDYRSMAATNYATGPVMPMPVSWIVKRALGASFAVAAELSNSEDWMDAVIPSANIYATAEEVSRFYQMLLNGGRWNGKQLLNRATVHGAVQAMGSARVDRTLLLPMRYSAGMMLGGSPVGIYGHQTHHAFGHIGLINKFCWADPDRQLSVAILTSGLCLVSHHLLALANVLAQINRHCKPG